MYKVEVNLGAILGKKVYRVPTLEKAQEFTDKYFEKNGEYSSNQFCAQLSWRT